jgi:23S rRNA U2552 (ribose-2'-O)-methylase RlmE/FtsJ
MELISEILLKYDTDKVRDHSYGHSYDRLFSTYNRDAELDILEVGVQKGWSLIAWREYFPNAHIVGIDVKDEVVEKKENIEYIVSDIKDVSLDKEFDIIIDDGSHLLKDVLYTVQNFKLKEGGKMIIEDCQVPPVWLREIERATQYGVEAIDLTSIQGWTDDYLIVLHN